MVEGESSERRATEAEGNDVEIEEQHEENGDEDEGLPSLLAIKPVVKQGVDPSHFSRLTNDATVPPPVEAHPSIKPPSHIHITHAYMLVTCAWNISGCWYLVTELSWSIAFSQYLAHLACLHSSLWGIAAVGGPWV